MNVQLAMETRSTYNICQHVQVKVPEAFPVELQNSISNHAFAMQTCMWSLYHRMSAMLARALSRPLAGAAIDTQDSRSTGYHRPPQAQSCKTLGHKYPC